MELQLLTTKEVAAMLGVTPTTMAIWRYRGKGPTWVQLANRMVRYRSADVEAFVRERTVTRPD
jgi:predicted DNA-binding transcriptional regulator AlpA